MPRRSKKSNSAKLGVEKLKRKCRYCKTHQDSRGFDKHEAWCKKTCAIRQELQGIRTYSAANQLQTTEVVPPAISSSLIGTGTGREFVEGPSLMPIEVEHLLPSHPLLSQVGGTLTVL